MLGVGASFAGYRIDGVLGKGGMGTVYLARHPRLPRSVALKLLNRELSTDPELVRRFEREADVIARLEHPAIVGVLDRGTDEGHLWIAMQYIRGTDAASWDAAAHPPATAVRLLAETAAALDYAHSRGVLHRDVKPANILIAEADAFRETRAILTDFGIARLTDAASTKVTATGTFTATLAYGSPEQLSGEKVDHRSDQYSLACTLFALLSGHAPYASTNPGQVIMGHLSQPVPRLTAGRPDLPSGIDAVLERAMAKQRHDRYATCSEFTTAARDALAGRHIAGDLRRSAPTALNQSPNGGVPVSPAPVAPQFRAPGPPPGPMAPAHPHAAGAAGPDERFAPRPSRATALTAGILVLLTGLIPTIMTFVGLGFVISGGNPSGDAVATLIFASLAVLYDGTGALLLSGRRAGRILAVICSGLGTATAGLGTVAGLADRQPGVVVIFSVLFVVSAATLLCAAAGATGRWVAYRTAIRNTPHWQR
ncbi:serine/threonine-protein kinase [Nocardia carnea]|uniref:serine/threonine-protein kinase n=1 Tax=Nocardia carnea TaxID=37328 RepID=UPI00245579BC|nr:serine/threonine-protein kinase [Nocardia carnea]